MSNKALNQLTDETYTRKSQGQLKYNTKQQQPNQEQLMAMQLDPTAMNLPTHSSSNQLPYYENEGNLERYVMEMNQQMQYLVAQNEIKNQQNENVMKMQQQRIIQLQQMCEQMKSEVDSMREGRMQIWDKNQNLQQGLSHLDMLNDFEMLSKNTPFSYKQTFLDNKGQNKFQDDSLNQFMHQFNAGSTPLNGLQRQIPPSQSSQMRQQQFQEPRLNSRQSSFSQPNNHFKSAASLSLNPQPYDQYQQQAPYGQYSNNPYQNQQQIQQNQGYPQSIQQKDNKFNPLIDRIEQQNQMLMKLIEDMDKPQKKKGNNQKKKRQVDSDDSDDTSDKDRDETETNEALIEQRQLEQKIQQLENSIKQQKMQSQYMIDNNIQNPDVQYLMNAANQRNNPMMQSNSQQFANSVYNQQQFGAAQMPGAAMLNNPKYQNIPPPDQFIQQVQVNQQKFKQHLPPQMSTNSGLGPNVMRPSFINDQSNVPHPNMLQQIFQQQLLNSRKN